MASELQNIPVRIDQSDTHIMLAAPMPGVEPEDISLKISGDKVTIKGEERGVGQDRRDVLVEEWRIGPYYREVSLPQPVNGALTNATYGNGVVILAMPKAAAGQKGVEAEIKLQSIAPTRGERVGHSGSDIHPVHRH
jgi:HSP20 family protein